MRSFRLGDNREAFQNLLKALEIFEGSRDVSGVVFASAYSGGVALELGDRQRAYRLAGAVEDLVVSSGVALIGIDANQIDGLDTESLSALTGSDRDAYGEAKTWDMRKPSSTSRLVPSTNEGLRVMGCAT